MYNKLSYEVDCIFCSKCVLYNCLNTSLLNVCTKPSCHHVLNFCFRPNNLFYNVYVSMAQTVHSCNVIYRQIICLNGLILVGHPYNPEPEPICTQGDDTTIMMSHPKCKAGHFLNVLVNWQFFPNMPQLACVVLIRQTVTNIKLWA
jgi:hypothetical protein